MQNGHFAGWEAEGNGYIMLASGDAFGSSYALESNGRRLYSDGLKQKLDMQCFLIAGKVITLSADVKLMQNDGPVTCQLPGSSPNWDDCPHFAIEAVLLGGRKRIIKLNANGAYDDNGVFKMRSEFRITEVFQWVKDVYVQVIGVHNSIKMLVDNVSVQAVVSNADACKELVSSSRKSVRISGRIYEKNVMITI